MEDRFDGSLAAENLQTDLKLIGAMDISYRKSDEQQGVACLVVCEYPSMKVVYEDYHIEVNISHPYVPGFLAFKEMP